MPVYGVQRLRLPSAGATIHSMAAVWQVPTIDHCEHLDAVACPVSTLCAAADMTGRIPTGNVWRRPRGSAPRS